MGSGFNFNANFTATIALGAKSRAKGLGILAQAVLARSVSASFGAAASGFSLQAMLYEGPACLFTFNGVTYLITINIRHQASLSVPGLAQWLYHVILDPVKARLESLSGRQDTALVEAEQPKGAASEDTLTGSVQFISHEELARQHPVDPADVTEVGKTRELAKFAQRQKYAGTKVGGVATPVVLPAIRGYLGDGQVVINPDDQVMGALGSGDLSKIVHGLLIDAGLDQDTVRDLPTVLTEPANLAAAIGGIRPGPIKHTFVRKGNLLKGELQDRHAVLTIEGFPTNARQASPNPVKLFQMHVAEGGPIVSAAKNKVILIGLNIGIPGLSWLFGENAFNWLQEITYGHGWYFTTGTAESLALTGGRLTQATRTYLETTADVVYRAYVVAQNKSLAADGDVEYIGKIVSVKDGISYLTLEKPAADPRNDAADPPHDPDTVMLIARQPEGGSQAKAANVAKMPRMRRVPEMRASRQDRRKIPMVPLLPPATASERLYPLDRRIKLLDEGPSSESTGSDESYKRPNPLIEERQAPAAGSSDASVGGNPVLNAVQELLYWHSPWALESYWTVESDAPREGEKKVPTRLGNVLNLQSLTTMMDLLLGPGLVLHPIKSGPAYNDRLQIVLQARRDSTGLGYAYLESIEGNTVRYMVGLDLKNKYWAKLKSGGMGTAASQTGEPTIHNPTTGPSGAGGARPGQSNGESDFGLESWELHPEGAVSQSSSAGGYQQSMKAQRDTIFAAGRSDRYGGDIVFEISVESTRRPSMLANTLGVPHYVAAWRQDTANQRRERPIAIVPLKERVLIPHSLIHHEVVLELPDGDIVAVEEVPLRADPAPATLKITAEDLRTRRVLNLGYDHEKLQVLFGEVMAKLAGNERPVSGQSSHAVARLTEHGTRAQDGLRYMLSQPMFSRYLDKQLGQDMTMPPLVREGGTWTDTHGELSVRVEFELNPLVLSNYTVWDEGVDSTFNEQGRQRSRGHAGALGATGGAGWRSGDQHRADPPAPNITDFVASVDAGGSAERSSSAIQQTMPRVDALNRALSWLRVSPDALITVTLTARNERDWIQPGKLWTWLGGGEVAVRFKVRNALELALSPEVSIDLDVYHPDGIPVGSGTFFPPPSVRRPASTGDLVRAAFSVPFFEGAFGVQIDWDGDHFLVGNRRIDATELGAAINTRLSQLGVPPAPDTPAEELPPPAPTKLNDPDDPLVIMAPNAAVITPGHTVTAAQAVADVTDRPAFAPYPGYTLTRDGRVLAVARPTPDSAVFGPEWEPGHWMLFYPRNRNRAAKKLPHSDLKDAIRAARDDHGLTLRTGGRPALVPPPSRDVHYPFETPEGAIGKWRAGAIAISQLTAQARELLRYTGDREADLTAKLERADSAVRAVPAAPAALPDPAQRAPLWQDLNRFSGAASDLGQAVADALSAALGRWQQQIEASLALPGQARRLLPRNGKPEPELANALPNPLDDALDRLDAAVRAIPRPPAGLPNTASEVADAVSAIARIEGRQAQVDADQAFKAVMTLAFKGLDERVKAASDMAVAAEGLLSFTGEHAADLRQRLTKARSELQEAKDQQRRLETVAALEDELWEVIADATKLDGLPARVAAAPDLLEAANQILPYTSEQQDDLRHGLEQAQARLKRDRPDWWPASGPELTNADKIDQAQQWLSDERPGRLREAIEELAGAAGAVAASANDASARLERLVRMANLLLERIGAQQGALGLALFRAGGTPAGTQFTAPRWPELRATTAEEAAAVKAQVQVAAQEQATFAGSAERLEDVVRRVLQTSVAEWSTRMATATALCGRLDGLQETTEQRHLLPRGLATASRTALLHAARLKTLPAPLTVREMEAAASDLDWVTFDNQSVEEAIMDTIAVVLDEPMRVVQGAIDLAGQLQVLLPHVNEQARARLLEQRNLPAASSPALDPVASRPMADLDKALSQGLTRLRALRTVFPGLTAAMADVLETGWQPLVVELTGLVSQARALLLAGGSALPAPRRDALNKALASADSGLLSRPALPPSPGAAALDAVGQALASVAAAQEVATDVIAEVNATLAEQTTAALERRDALHLGQEQAQGKADDPPALSQWPPSEAETTKFTEAMGAAVKRLDWLSMLTKTNDRLFAKATADADALRSRVEGAERLASDALALLPYTGGSQRTLTDKLDLASGQLREIRPGWWLRSESSPVTLEQVKAARRPDNADLPDRLGQVAQVVENVVADLLQAIDVDGWDQKAAELRKAVEDQEDLLSATGELRAELVTAIEQALGRLPDSAGLQRQLQPLSALNDADKAQKMPAVISAVASVTELETAIYRVAEVANDTAWQRAMTLMSLIPSAEGLLAGVPPALRAGLTTARQTARALWPRSAPATTGAAIRSARQALDGVTAMRAAISKVLTQATADLPALVEAAETAFAKAGALPPLRDGQRQELQMFTDHIRNVPDDGQLDADKVRQGATALTALRRVLNPIALRRRAQAAIELGGAAGDAVHPEDIEKVRTAVGRLPERPLGPNDVSGFGQAMTEVMRLEATTKIAATDLARQVHARRQSAEKAGFLAAAARTLLRHTGQEQDALADRLNGAAALVGPDWLGRLPVAGADLVTADELRAARKALAERANIEAAALALNDEVTAVLTAANKVIDERARSVTEIAGPARALLQYAGVHQVRLKAALDHASKEASGLQGQQVRPATLAGVGATGRDLDRITTFEADVWRVVEEVTDGLRERVAGAPALVSSAQALLADLVKQAGDGIGPNLPKLGPDLEEGARAGLLARLPAEPPSTALEVTAAATALQGVTRVEQASREVLSAAYAFVETTRQAAETAMKRSALAQALQWPNDPSQAELTEGLKDAVKTSREVRQPRLPEAGKDRVRTTDLDAYRLPLPEEVTERLRPAEEVAKLRAATEDLNSAVNKVLATAQASWEHWEKLNERTQTEVDRLFPKVAERPGTLIEAHDKYSKLWQKARPHFRREEEPEPATTDFAAVGTTLEDMVVAAKKLEVVLRATPWCRAEALLGRDHTSTREQVTRVMDLVDSLPAGREAQTDAERFAWLAGRIALPDPDDFDIEAVGPPADQPAIQRLYAVLDLATQVYETTEIVSARGAVTLGDLANLSVLADIVRAETGAPEVTLADLEAKYRQFHNIETQPPVTRSSLKELVEQVGQVRATRREVRYTDLMRLASARDRLVQVRTYLEATGQDLRQQDRLVLIWGLLGDETGGALQAVLQLLNASSAEDLADMFGNRGLAEKLLSAIPADHPLRPQLTEFTRERFAVLPEQLTRRTARIELGRRYSPPDPVDRTFSPRLIHASLDVGLDDALTVEQFGHAIGAIAGPSGLELDPGTARNDNAVLRKLGLSVEERRKAVSWLNRFHAAVQRQLEIDGHFSGQPDKELDQAGQQRVIEAALEGLVPAQAWALLDDINDDDLKTLVGKELTDRLEKAFPSGHALRERADGFRALRLPSGQVMTPVVPKWPFKLTMISPSLAGMGVRSDLKPDELEKVGAAIARSMTGGIVVDLPLSQRVQEARLGWWDREVAIPAGLANDVVQYLDGNLAVFGDLRSVVSELLQFRQTHRHALKLLEALDDTELARMFEGDTDQAADSMRLLKRTAASYADDRSGLQLGSGFADFFRKRFADGKVNTGVQPAKPFHPRLISPTLTDFDVRHALKPAQLWVAAVALAGRSAEEVARSLELPPLEKARARRWLGAVREAMVDWILGHLAGLSWLRAGRPADAAASQLATESPGL